MAKREPVYGTCTHCKRSDVILARWAPGTEVCGACKMYEYRHGHKKPIEGQETVKLKVPLPNGKVQTVVADAATTLRSINSKNRSIAMHNGKMEKKVEELQDEVKMLRRRLKKRDRRIAELEALLAPEDEEGEED